MKLNKSESAWKPNVISKNDNDTPEEEMKTQELLKKVRSILNKLTLENFDTLLKQIRNLEIDNQKRLKGTIDLIFEKAIDEPSFIVYSRLCHKLAHVSEKSCCVVLKIWHQIEVY